MSTTAALSCTDCKATVAAGVATEMVPLVSFG